MIPKSISASALLVYEGCAARFKAEYVDRARDESNSAADLGSVCHEVLEEWVATGCHLDDSKGFTAMEAMYVKHYFTLFSDTERYEEGKELLQKWHDRQDWSDRKVMSTEEKLSFQVPTTEGPLTFNYIMDRFDELSNGEYEVVDYKTVMAAVQPEELKHKIQARAYALAAQLQFPDAEKIWVTFDLLRYNRVGVAFTKEENRLTWKQITSVAQRIVDDNPTGEEGEVWPAETINAECKYCIRKANCETLLKHSEAGGLAGVDLDAEPAKLYELIDIRSKAKWQAQGLDSLLKKVESMILDYMMENDIRELQGHETEVTIKGRQTRNIDKELVRRVVGDDIFLDHATIGTTAVDKMLKDDERVTDEMKSVIKSGFTKAYGRRWLDSKPIPEDQREA